AIEEALTFALLFAGIYVPFRIGLRHDYLRFILSGGLSISQPNVSLEQGQTNARQDDFDYQKRLNPSASKPFKFKIHDPSLDRLMCELRMAVSSKSFCSSIANCRI